MHQQVHCISGELCHWSEGRLTDTCPRRNLNIPQIIDRIVESGFVKICNRPDLPTTSGVYIKKEVSLSICNNNFRIVASNETQLDEAIKLIKQKLQKV